MSFANKKTRVFKEAGDAEVQRKRSDGRMKTYQSATDARAWCDSTEERRQHILDLVRQGDGKGLSLGKYIPIEAIIDILLANKNADIKRLQQENDDLRNLIKKHGLAYQEKERPIGVTELGATESDEDAGAGRSGARPGSARFRESDEASTRGADAASISTKDSRARRPGAPIDAKESAASRGSRRSGTESQMDGPVSGAPLEFGGEESGTTGDGTTSPFVSDSSDYEGDSPGYGRPISAEDKKAAAEFLADKSPEEQVQALKQALAEREDLFQEQQDIAVAAIEKLENIKDIVEDTEDPNKPKQRKERDTGLTSLKSDGLNDLKEECIDLRRRLGSTDGLEEAIRRLKGEAHQGGDSTEKDKLLAKIAELEKEVQHLKCKLKEIEILKVERDCLKNRLDDLFRIQKDYEELLKKTQGFDALKADCALYKVKCEELQGVEAECNELRAKVKRLDELENERALLMKEIQDCECCMNNQEDEIKRLACHIECLNENLDKRQDEMKVKMITMRAHLEKKEDIIAKSEQQLADVQDQLHNSIESLSCETSCLRNRIEELEDEVKEYEDKISEYEKKIIEFRRNLEFKEENNKALLEKLENEKNTSAKLEEELKKAIKGDEHLQQLLKQVKCAVKCITQKIANHEIVNVAKMVAEKENYDRKIKELEDQVANAEELQNEFTSLKQQLEKEKKLREQAEAFQT